MQTKHWYIKPHSEHAVKLSNGLGVSEITAKILMDRGIQSKVKAREFLCPDYDNLHSPWLLPDMELAVKRIMKALKNDENITIYGDYDVDGQTSIALLVSVLESLASGPGTINYYVPNREKEGYGLHQGALTKIAETSSLVITVDCGISAIPEIDYARSIGLDVIVTDHHEPGIKLPAALGVINPKRIDSEYPFSQLAGVGVAYKLVQALGEKYQRDFRHWLDLVALGTVADLVPLINENRIFVSLGLKQLERTSLMGLKALLKVCNVKGPCRASDLGFKLGPRLNAVGRMGESGRGIELLLSSEKNQAQFLAGVLDSENKLRQEIEAEIFSEALTIIEENNWSQDPVILVAKENWHVGVIGIVASRLVEKYYRPIILISIENGLGKGSARSISGFNLYQALSSCQELLLEFGGHEMAAGLSISPDNVVDLRKSLANLAKQVLKSEDYIPKVRIDAEITLKDINHHLLKELKLLEPFGIGNPTPVFKFSGSVLNIRSMGRAGEHLRCLIQDQQGQSLEAVGFGMYQAMEENEKYREMINFAVYPQYGYYDPNKFELLLRDFQVPPVFEATSYIEDWCINRYPWETSIDYQNISHLRLLPFEEEPLTSELTLANIIDSRDSWDKTNEIRRLLSPDQTSLIYGATPERVMELCRNLRISIPKGNEFVGFEHELLTTEERNELEQLLDSGKLRWVITTGVWSSNRKWDQILLYDAFCHSGLLMKLIEGLKADGILIFLYGKQDCRWLQGKIQSRYPNRQTLAELYLGLIKAKNDVSLKDAISIGGAIGLREGLLDGLNILEELDLIKKADNQIKILPKPVQRLDLNTSLLYNECITRREQCLAYLQCCLERGFIHGFKRKD